MTGYRSDYDLLALVDHDSVAQDATFWERVRRLAREHTTDTAVSVANASLCALRTVRSRAPHAALLDIGRPASHIDRQPDVVARQGSVRGASGSNDLANSRRRHNDPGTCQ